MKRKSIYALGALAVVLAAAFLYLDREAAPTKEPAAAAAAGPVSSSEAPAASSDPVVVEEASSAPVSADPPSEQVLATRAMYAAHASLRADEVDDPDSATNQRIKSEMIQKALARSSSETSQP